MSVQMTRRTFLRSSCISAATVALLRPTESKAWVVAAIAIASAVAGVVSAFTKRGDGGLSAILSSIRELQLETIGQLRIIQTGLADIDAKLQVLPNQIAGLLDQAKLKELDAELKGSFEGFREAVAVRNAKRRLSARERASAAQSQRDVRDRAVAARHTLQNYSDIAGLPHAALIATYILPIEMSLRVFVNDPKEQIAVALQSYREWQQAMIDPSAANAIPAYVSSWLDVAEKRYIAASDSNAFAKSLFANSPGAVERCYVYREYDPGSPAKYRHFGCGARCEGDGKWVLEKAAVPARTGQESRVYSRVVQTIDDQSGARLISMLGSDRIFGDWAAALDTVTTASQSLQINTSTIPGEAQQVAPAFEVRPNILTIQDQQLTCVEQNAAFGLPPEERIKKIMSEPVWGRATLKGEFDQTWDAVQGINEARLHVAFGVSCRQVAEALLNEIERCERLYAS